ncbi:hypothetical protein [Streptomyces sp. NPDC048825]
MHDHDFARFAAEAVGIRLLQVRAQSGWWPSVQTGMSASVAGPPTRPG